MSEAEKTGSGAGDRVKSSLVALGATVLVIAACMMGPALIGIGAVLIVRYDGKALEALGLVMLTVGGSVLGALISVWLTAVKDSMAAAGHRVGGRQFSIWPFGTTGAAVGLVVGLTLAITA